MCVLAATTSIQTFRNWSGIKGARMNERRSSWASDGGCWTCSKDFSSEIKAVRDVNVTVSRETGRRRRSDRPNIANKTTRNYKESSIARVAWQRRRFGQSYDTLLELGAIERRVCLPARIWKIERSIERWISENSILNQSLLRFLINLKYHGIRNGEFVKNSNRGDRDGFSYQRQLKSTLIGS